MTENRTNFEVWYKESLAILYDREEAGFPILMITFPLLDRYLAKVVSSGQQPSTDDALLKIFSELNDLPTAKLFWNVSRNSLLHDVSLSRPNRRNNQTPLAWVTHDKCNISIDQDGNFWINPVDFSKRVVQTIEADFSTFEGKQKEWPLPTVQTEKESRRSGPVQVGSVNWLSSKK